MKLGLLTAVAIAMGAAALISPVWASEPMARQSSPVGAGAEPPARAPRVLFVDGRGDDGAAGTRLAPLRSITAALSAARSKPTQVVDGTIEQGLIEIRISIGTYDKDAGEQFPLDLTGGVTLRGLGSGISVIDGGDEALILRLGVEAPGRAQLSGLSVRGSGVGLALGSASLASESPRRVSLEDVLFEGLDTGVALDLGSAEEPQPIELRADGLRTRDTSFGLRILGEGQLDMHLLSCDLRDGKIGITLESDPAENLNLGEPRSVDEEGVALVWHNILIEDCWVSGMSEAGILRVGRDGRNRGAAYRFEDCTFEGNQIGIEFRRPCLDAQVEILRSRFLSNERFGLQLTGHLGTGRENAGELNLIEDCVFRWNGVGAHITSSQLPLLVDRSVFRNNQGNGLFVSNFLTDPTEVRVEASLFANNGSHGIYSLADGRLQSVSILGCTVVDNDAGGIRDHRRHAGSSNFDLRGCIVVGNGNGNDLSDVNLELASYCLIGDMQADAQGDEVEAQFSQRRNLSGLDPGFVDRALGDYHLGVNSPCRDGLSAPAREDMPLHDLDGNARPDPGFADSLGCYTGR